VVADTPAPTSPTFTGDICAIVWILQKHDSFTLASCRYVSRGNDYITCRTCHCRHRPVEGERGETQSLREFIRASLASPEVAFTIRIAQSCLSSVIGLPPPLRRRVSHAPGQCRMLGLLCSVLLAEPMAEHSTHKACTSLGPKAKLCNLRAVKGRTDTQRHHTTTAVRQNTCCQCFLARPTAPPTSSRLSRLFSFACSFRCFSSAKPARRRRRFPSASSQSNASCSSACTP